MRVVDVTKATADEVFGLYYKIPNNINYYQIMKHLNLSDKPNYDIEDGNIFRSFPKNELKLIKKYMLKLINENTD